MIRFSILIPTRHRVDYIINLINSIILSSYNFSQIEILVGYDSDDKETYSRVVTRWPEHSNINFYERERSYYINRDYYNWLAEKARGKYIICVNDDTVFEKKLWDKLAFEKLENYISNYKDGIVYGVPDDCEVENRRAPDKLMACFPLISKRAVNVLGFFFDPEFPRDGADWSIVETYKKIDRVLDLRDCIVIKHISVRAGRRIRDHLDDVPDSNRFNPPIETCVQRNYIKFKKYMEEIMDFSLIAPSVRPHLWEQFYDSVKNTKINYEIIFVGPNPPKETLPSNFKWIVTNVKPSQCTHIGFMEAKGEIISLTADDAQYFSPNKESAIDNIYHYIKKFQHPHSKKIAYGFRMFEDNFCVESSLNHYLVSPEKNLKLNPVLLYPFFAIYKDTYLELGGYDNRFICGQAENDFLLRIAEYYGDTASGLCPTAMVWANHEAHTNSGKFRDYHAIESETLKKLWLARNEFFIRERQDKRVCSYINENLLIISQGEKGEWI